MGSSEALKDFNVLLGYLHQVFAFFVTLDLHLNHLNYFIHQEI